MERKASVEIKEFAGMNRWETGLTDNNKHDRNWKEEKNKENSVRPARKEKHVERGDVDDCLTFLFWYYYKESTVLEANSSLQRLYYINI